MKGMHGTSDIVMDERDKAYVDEAIGKRANNIGPMVGDYVIFSDGIRRRIAQHWPDGVQTADDGSFHLLPTGTMSFSGSLYGSIPFDVLTDSGETELAWAWVFHHNQREANNGVDFQVPVRVWHASIPGDK
jgi:hypothetical protein